MLIVVSCETVTAVKVRTCTEIEIFMILRRKNRIEAGLWRDIDRCRRKTGILICIIWRVHLQMLLEYPVELVIETEGHSRIGLKTHSLAVAVKIYSCNARIFESLEGLAADDGRNHRDLHRRKLLSLGLGKPVLVPECIILLFQTVEDVLHRSRPIHLVGVRQNHRKDILRGEAVFRKELLGIESLDNRSRIRHHLGGYLLGQTLLRADGSGKGHVAGSLPAELEHTAHIYAGERRLDDISSRLHLGLKFHFLEAARQTAWSECTGPAHEGVDDRLHRRVGTDEEDIFLREIRTFVVVVPASEEEAGCRTCEGDHCNEDDVYSFHVIF